MIAHQSITHRVRSIYYPLTKRRAFAVAEKQFANASTCTTAEAYALATQAYIFGFACVAHSRTLRAYALEAESPEYIGWNRMRHTASLSTTHNTAQGSPNNDMLATIAVIDVRTEPVILSVPKLFERYYSFQFLDIFTNHFAAIGTCTTGIQAGRYAITGPNWQGTLPAGVVRIQSPAGLILALGRTEVRGAADIAAGKAVQARYQLLPLSAGADSARRLALAPIDRHNLLTGMNTSTESFIQNLNFMLQWQNLTPAETGLLRRLAKIGVVAGQRFHANDLSPAIVEAITEGLAAGHAQIEQRAATLGITVNGWQLLPHYDATLAQDYLTRAALAWHTLYLEPTLETLCWTRHVDEYAQALHGKHRYVLNFPMGATPPVNCFWSLTAYDAHTHLPLQNPMQRCSIGDRTLACKAAADGVLRIYIQHTTPSKEHESNWLPTPKAEFYLMLRTYGPQPALLNGSYKIPPLQMVQYNPII